jgi:hypothetical protein
MNSLLIDRHDTERWERDVAPIAFHVRLSPDSPYYLHVCATEQREGLYWVSIAVIEHPSGRICAHFDLDKVIECHDAGELEDAVLAHLRL